MSTQPKTFITPEQYLEIERKAEFKSEYYNGEMFPLGGETVDMASASWAHNLLVGNAVGLLHEQLRSRNCCVAPSDVRIYVPATGLFTYPDAIVVCDKPQFQDDRRDTLLNPALIIEVLSPSTEAYDRGRKFEHYRSVASLKYYVLISADRMYLERYTRQPNGLWLFESASKPEETVTFEAIGCSVKLSDLYEKVEFA
jgi:Uma2 family endonuclease